MSTPGGVALGGSGNGSGKVCVACGEDVANKPRTKDAKGRYYCKACYDKAISEKHAKREGMTLPKAPARKPEPPLAPLGWGASPDADAGADPNVLENLLVLEPAHAAPAMVCPSCKSAIPAGGVLCTMCGYNMQSGAQLGGPQIKKAKAVGSGSVWPLVIGILSIGYGVVDGSLLVFSFLDSLNNEGRRLHVALIPFVLNLCLIYAALQIMARRPAGARTMKQWAYLKTILGITCFGLMFVGTATGGGPSGAISERMGFERGEIDQATLFVVLAVEFVWYTGWAIFVLIWFHRAAIDRQVDEWAS